MKCELSILAAGKYVDRMCSARNLNDLFHGQCEPKDQTHKLFIVINIALNIPLFATDLSFDHVVK